MPMDEREDEFPELDDRDKEADDRLKRLIGRRIQLARKTLGLTQTELGKMLNKAQDAISEYETGERILGADTLLMMSYALMVPIDYFFPDKEGDHPEVNERDRLLIARIKMLPETERD